MVGSFDQNWKCFHIASLLLYQFQFFPCSFQVINFWNIGFGYISFIIWKYFQFLLIELHQSEILHFGIKIGLAHHSPSMRNIKQWTQSLLLSIICNWAFFPSIIRNVTQSQIIDNKKKKLQKISAFNVITATCLGDKDGNMLVYTFCVFNKAYMLNTEGPWVP